MRELSECILSTLLGSFILTWTIHEVYCHLKMMNFSVDVLVYHVLVLFQKKKEKEKEASPKVWGSRAPQFSPIATCTVMSLAACWLVSVYVIGLPQGKKDAGPGGLYNRWRNFENFPPSEVGEFNKTKSPGSITDLKSFHLRLFTIFFSLMM